MPDEPDSTETQPSARPTPKMTAVALGGAFATVVAWFLTLADIEPPAAVVAAFAVIFAWICGYVTHD